MSHNKRKSDDINAGNELPGWPGYRTRSNRSGLDPLDTRSEAAHMQGTFLRNIFTLRARTRNPFYLFLMFVFGVAPFLTSMAVMISGMPAAEGFSLARIIYLIVFIFVTGAVTINFLLSILEILGIIPARKQMEKSQARTKKRKSPKRRKDFR